MMKAAKGRSIATASVLAILQCVLWLAGSHALAGDLYTDDLRVYGELRVADVDSVPTNSIEVYYRFTTDESGIVSDESGNSNTGTVIGATWTSSGKSGGGLSFDGSNDYVNIGDNDPITAGTVALWLKLDSIGATEYLVSKVKSGSNDGEWRLYVESDGDMDFKIQSTNNTYSILSDDALTSNTWYHVAVTWEKNSSMSMYVNGSVQQQTATPTVGMEVTEEDLNLGRNNALGNSYLGGVMDEVVIYTRVLSAQEIYDVYLESNPPQNAGFTYVKPLGDIEMGIYTNQP